jgi:hypothetical protein
MKKIKKMLKDPKVKETVTNKVMPTIKKEIQKRKSNK